jgi:hypothetical protein
VKPGARVIVLLEHVRKLENRPEEFHLRTLYNNFIKGLCGKTRNLTYLDVNTATHIDWLWDDAFHMHRQGYYELAQAVRKMIEDARTPDPTLSFLTPIAPIYVLGGQSWQGMSTDLPS